MNDRALLRKHFSGASANAQLWAAVDAATLERLRTAASRSLAQVQWACYVCSALALVAAAYSFASMCEALPEGWPVQYTGMVLGLVTLATVGTGFLMSMREDSCSRLKPLGEDPQLCQNVLNQLGEPAVRAYRDQVVSRGRELVVADAQCMADLYVSDLQEREKEKQRQLCQQVHGVYQPSAGTAA